jgi:multimeric flavodoxin WrbA
MSKPKQALLLWGSPKVSKSNSESLGNYLLGKLRSGGFETEKLQIQGSMRSKDAQAKMLERFADSDLIVLAFPLYMDTLPASVIAALELIAKQRKTSAQPKTQQLVAIIQNGLREATQNDTALAICKRFAFEAGIDWAGGLTMGSGEAINGKPLEDAGFLVRNARKALDLAAKDLLAGKAVSGQAADLMAKPIAPIWLYLFVANRQWKKRAKVYGTQNKLYTQPN